MPNWKMEMAYIGRDFYGFQKQPGKRTVQGELERILSLIFDEEIKVIGAGRTDAGVHALGQVVNFNSKRVFSREKLYRVLDRMLPYDIKLKNIEEVDETFHARFSAKRRWYMYMIYNSKERNIFLKDYAWWIKEELDKKILLAASSIVKGVYDFRNFCIVEKSKDDTIVEIYDSFWYFKNCFLFYFISAPFFLRKMVRFIVSSLVEVAKGDRTLEELRDYLIFYKPNRFSAPAPPQGLYLYRIDY